MTVTYYMLLEKKGEYSQLSNIPLNAFIQLLKDDIKKSKKDKFQQSVTWLATYE